MLCESRVSATSVQPCAPPAAFMSRNAISTDFAPACPYSPAGPVSSITTPMGIVHSAARAGAAVLRMAAASAAAEIDGRWDMAGRASDSVKGSIAPADARRQGRGFVLRFQPEGLSVTGFQCGAALRLYFITAPWRPVRSRSSA